MNSPYRDNVVSEFNETNSKLVEVEEIECFFFSKDRDEYRAKKKFESNLYLRKHSVAKQRIEWILKVEGWTCRDRLKQFLKDAYSLYGGYLFDDIFIPSNNLINITIVSKKTKQLLTLKNE